MSRDDTSTASPHFGRPSPAADPSPREDRVSGLRPPGDPARARAWADNVEALSLALAALAVTDREGQALGPDQGFTRLLRLTDETRQAEATAYFIGNGASATLASHAAVDLLKNSGLPTMPLTDQAALTAFANDYTYAEVFAASLKIRLKRGDMLVAISSSGQSPSILNACYLARRRQAEVVTFSAMKADNTLRGLGTLNFYLPAATYGLAETGHAAILHHWVDLAGLAFSQF